MHPLCCYVFTSPLSKIQNLAGATGKCHATQHLGHQTLGVADSSEVVIQGAYVDGVRALGFIARGPYVKGMNLYVSKLYPRKVGPSKKTYSIRRLILPPWCSNPFNLLGVHTIVLV